MGRLTDVVGSCARCHGTELRGPASGLVPVLHGQPKEFVSAALWAYANGLRHSGIMQPVAAELRADEIAKLADYYAGIAAPKQASRTDAPATAHSLATGGDPMGKFGLHHLS